MVTRNRSAVYKRSGRKRGGRGFSREELRRAGVGLKQALHLGLPVDMRRRTAHQENIELAREQFESLKPAPKPPKKPAPEPKSNKKEKASRKRKGKGSKV